MKLHDAFFYFASFFLVGVFIASFKINFAIIVWGVFLLATVFLLFSFLTEAAAEIPAASRGDERPHIIENGRSPLLSVKEHPDPSQGALIPRPFGRGSLKNKNVSFAILSLAIILGAFYYNIYDRWQIKVANNIPFEEKNIFRGIIADYPENGNAQKLIIELQASYSGKILANLKSYPSFKYGDLIDFEGIIRKPEPQNYANYLSKNGIFGTINYPKIKFIAENKGNALKSKLFKLKSGIVENFQKVLAPEKATFLAGLTIGERGEFSKEFKDKMSRSGTTHLVALSGYNITIIAVGVTAFFGYFLRRELVFWLSIITIIIFVLMTGAEASVVRAAIMGGIILLANHIGRIHSMRNAIAAAAFVMILINPKVLRFDLGFQLSFAALMGIVYLVPAIQKFFKIKEEEGILGWRANLLNTTSAQLAVLPLILINFNTFSLFSLLANILILEAVPITMFLGFLIGVAGFIFLPLAIILGWFTNLFLTYELDVIDIFSKFPQSNFKMGIFSAMVYYSIIIGFIFFFSIKTKNNKNKFDNS